MKDSDSSSRRGTARRDNQPTTVTQEQNGVFDVSIEPCGCRSDDCGRKMYRAKAEIDGDDWTVRAGPHYGHVQTHKNHYQKRDAVPVTLDEDRDKADVLRDAFFREVERIRGAET